MFVPAGLLSGRPKYSGDAGGMKRSDLFKVSVILPCCNEQDNIVLLAERIIPVLSRYHDYEILFIDDGSSDKSLEKIQFLSNKNPKIKYISFSRNFGHQVALKAGYDHTSGDCVISMDADLQHPPESMEQMIEKWREGYDIVYAVRQESKNLSFLKRASSNLFYALLAKLSPYDVGKGISDYRLVDKAVVMVFRSINEASLFIRGMMPWVGFKQCSIKYEPSTRHSGRSKYSTKKMFLFALDGITSLSIVPLRLSSLAGLFILLFSIGYGAYLFILNILWHIEVSGLKLIAVLILLCSGLQLAVLGILGEYLGRIFIQTKNRPLYIIERTNIET
jgi:glycosyltransferase involved in cell wall biosynthesis